MKSISYCYLVLAIVVFASFSSFAQPNYWQAIQENNTADFSALTAVNNSRITNAQTLAVDIDGLRKTFSQVTHLSKTIAIALPLPDGTLADFILTPSSVMASTLSDKYPNIRTFSGYQVGHQANSGRFDLTINGFHGMFNYFGVMVFVEPKLIQITKKNQQYVSYYRKDNIKFNESVANITPLIMLHAPKKIASNPFSALAQKNAPAAAELSHIRTYRLAVTTAGEYSQFHGGSIEQTLAEIVTLVNRLNSVFQRDLSVKLELVANNDLLIFTDPATDPFANDSNDGDINTQVIDDIIGNDSYDIGHIVSTGGGGLAVLGGVCDRNNKADGVTGDVNPTNDAFYIDYVAHEIGHQFGANHTFNGAESACSGNRVANAAYEPGSASTIMGYAGICGSQNLQSHSDAYFHTKSIEEMATFISQGTGSTCGLDSTTVNNTPIVDAGSNYTIPTLTPFMLAGNATDADGDNLSYSWEEYDLGTVSTSVLDQIDDGSRPLFRVNNPTGTAIRIVPNLPDVLANTISIGEVYPSTNRELNFRLIVRDGKGGTNVDAMKITTVDTGEAFAVTQPIANELWENNQQTVSWNVANTDVAPILCSAVNISLSTDGGNNFATVLATNVANNGSAEVSLATVNSTSTRIKVACSNNIFFAVNEGEFTTNTVDPNTIAITGQQDISITQGESINLTTNLFSYIEKSATSLTVLTGDNYSVSANQVTPNADFSGNLVVGITAHLANNTSDVFNVAITVIEKIVPVVVPPETAKSSGGSWFWLLGLITFILLAKEYFNRDKSNIYDK